MSIQELSSTDCPTHMGQRANPGQVTYHCADCAEHAYASAAPHLVPTTSVDEKDRHLDHIGSAFGRERVTPFVRQARIRAIFQSIAGRYDLMNDLLSGFMHRAWKKRFVDCISLDVEGPLVDIAGGTGDIAELLVKRFSNRAVTVLDPSTNMLEVAQDRLGERCSYLAAQAESWPIADNSYAAATLSFGLRNFTRPSEAFEEIYRVLQPGGRLYILEFSKPDPWLAPIYGLYARTVIPAIGALVTGNRGAYRYLVESISGFPSLATVSNAMTESGLEFVHCEKVLFGVAAIHIAEKPA